MFSMTPASLNRFILQHSIDNKFGHTQKPKVEDISALLSSHKTILMHLDVIKEYINC